MLVSWNWLSRYVDLSMDRTELETRLSLSGLNHEETDSWKDNPALVEGDYCIDLEVTSNRGDCLGHIGVAREIAVLFDLDLKVPDPKLSTSATDVNSLLKVDNRFAEACPRYTARVIQGVKVGPSPDWLVEALRSVFWRRNKDQKVELPQSVNNIVDATNYVMMECGQPLHAFDYAKLAGQQIVVRPGQPKETITAIDHREYELDESTCVIADANHACAVAGVMGGADSEVTESTTDLVIEAAIFTPLFVRRSARALKLHSPSSYRFERRVDPVGLDWASRRVCELIVDIAGGSVAEGLIDTAPDVQPNPPVVLRLSQIERILGIKVSADETTRILNALGCETKIKIGSDEGSFVPPTWRHDLSREADLIEEVARVHGYEKIPEDSPIPVAPSSKRPFDVAAEKIRHTLTASGYSEAMTPSVVRKVLDDALSVWTERPALVTQTAMLKGAKTIRRSLLPSLLEARANNWASASIEANLFEMAHVYLPDQAAEGLPEEHYSVGIVSGENFFVVKGAVETLCQSMGIGQSFGVKPKPIKGFVEGQVVELTLGDDCLGYLGVVDPKTLKQWKLPGNVVVCELSMSTLMDHAQLVPQQQSVSMYPSVERDLNFVMKESVRWNDLESIVRSAVGDQLKAVTYRETYRDAERDGNDKKRILMTVQLQRDDATLSGDEADALVQAVIGKCKSELGAELLG
ncbi:phenylalanine--tRNA ligase subunit beta [Rhodopirellula sp. MGV]|uniref:phenylalanine--tRNA ligase subunit beta n=1 Tax=Rhodopirellula sp. MGV TaxID=2023130 RepID=UPI000B962C75|nr:phenylalanine--tRNA ligase subunit beta [Rhodopirellula sp. MGV]OYP29399.1 phenylalanine--tRNA ligase subunit beta [Rhodopirellula sp. MGV]PNY35705.1 phenylalanine--tRNA ligase subunit beta [Rhodopirellula baltica]